jgi:Flp pilus assembly pilin Flp
MIDKTRIQTAEPLEFTRDERSMRLVEYAMAVLAVAAALILSLP